MCNQRTRIMKIFIAGGTSGIGLSIAKEYLGKGHNVAVCGRNNQKQMPDKEYPLLKIYLLDIYNKELLREAVFDFADNELDMMIISAGNYSDDSLCKLNYQESTDMLKINIAGAVNALEVAREAMVKKHSGHIVVLASASGLLNYKKATIYSKTKRALIQIADAYRKALSDFGVTITTVAPGYVDTPKLRELNNGDLTKKPFVIDSEEAAKIIIKAVEENKEFIVFPVKMKYLMYFLSGLPSWLLNIIMYKKAKWMNRK